MKWLFSNNFRWEQLVLDDIIETNPLWSELKKWLEIKHIKYDLSVKKNYFINLNRPWSSILNETSKSFVQRDIKRAKKKLDKKGRRFRTRY